MAEELVKSNSLHLWTESFGEKQNPAILLIMGAGGQGIFWPDVFCNELAKHGYFVIRYDHRDTGKSSHTDFMLSPYTLQDLLHDALAILDAYSIQQAHIISASMGGFIGQLLAIDYPERICSLISIMSSPDQSVIAAALEKKDTSQFALPPPSPEFINFLSTIMQNPPHTQEQIIEDAITFLKILSGGTPFNEEEMRSLCKKAVERSPYLSDSSKHGSAIILSPGRTNRLKHITAPTLIIHGEKDPVIPIEHGIATARIIPHAKFIPVKDMGHLIDNRVAQKLLPIILEHLKSSCSQPPITS